MNFIPDLFLTSNIVTNILVTSLKTSIMVQELVPQQGRRVSRSVLVSHIFNRKIMLSVSVAFFWLCGCGILVPWLGIEPRPSEVRTQNPNLWTTREFPLASLITSFFPSFHLSFLPFFFPPSLLIYIHIYLCLSDLILWIYLLLPLYNGKGFDLGHAWMV